VQNLTRGIGASYAVANVSAQVSGLVIVMSASTWVAAITIPGDKEAIVIGLAALIVAQCMTALPWPAIYTSPLALAMSTAVAGILSVLVFDDSISWPAALVLGVIMGLLVAAVDRMLGLIAYATFQAANLEAAQNIELKKNVEKARSFAVQLALGAAPIAVGGVVVYALERVALGGTVDWRHGKSCRTRNRLLQPRRPRRPRRPGRGGQGRDGAVQGQSLIDDDRT